MNKDDMRAWLNLAVLLAMLAINYLANALPLNGLTTGKISDRFDVLFKPAGITFAIWSIIYLGLTAFAVYQFLPAQRANPRLRAIGVWFAVSGLANSTWLIFWHYELFPLTMMSMLMLLCALIVIYVRINADERPLRLAEKWLLRLPFSLYLAWICVATAVNVTILLDYLGWSGFALSDETWAAVLIMVTSVLALAFGTRFNDVSFMLVIAWAIYGIARAQADSNLITSFAGIMIAIIIGVATIIKIRKARTTLVAP